MIATLYEFLESLDDVIKTPSRGVDRPASLMTQGGKLKRLAKTGPEVQERGANGGKLPPKFEFKSGPSVATKASELPQDVEGCRIMYKGGAMKRLESAFQANRMLDFAELRSQPPTDFSSTGRGLYFTKLVEVA